MLTETQIETRACERCLNELGVRSIKLTLGSDTGWPDRLFFIPGGKPLLIEFKAPGCVAEPHQKLKHAFLEYNEYGIQTHDTVEGAFQAVKGCVAAAFASGWYPDVKKAASILAATRLSKTGSEIPIRPRSRRTVP